MSEIRKNMLQQASQSADIRQDSIERSHDGLEALKGLNEKQADQFTDEANDLLKKKGLDLKINRNDVKNKEFIKQQQNNLENGKTPEGNNALTVALAAFAPSLLGALFGGAETGAAIAKGTFQGATAGLDIAKGLQDLKNDALELQNKLGVEVEFDRNLVNKKDNTPVYRIKNTNKWVDSDGKEISGNDIKDQGFALKQAGFGLREKDIKRKSTQFAKSLDLRYKNLTEQQRKAFDTREDVKNLRNVQSSINNLTALVKSGSMVAVKAIPRAMALMSGEQRLTDFDVRQFEEYGPISRILEAKFKRNIKGMFTELKQPLTGFEVREIKKFMNSIQNRINVDLNAKIENFAASRSLKGVTGVQSVQQLKKSLQKGAGVAPTKVKEARERSMSKLDRLKAIKAKRRKGNK